MENITQNPAGPAVPEGRRKVLRPEHVLQWHITHKCNLRCKHCYQDEYASGMSREELFAVLDKYERFLQQKALHGHINLTGGEPLVSPYFFELAEEIVRRGMTFAVLTNGTLIDEQTAVRLALLHPRFVQISLDGDPDVHDAIRGAGASAGAYRGIDLLKAYGVHVLVSFTAQRTNRFQLDNVARICKRHNVDKLWWDRVIIPKEEDTDRLMLTPRQFRVLVWKSGRLTKKTRREDGTSLCTSVRGLQFLYCPDTLTYHCSAGRDLLIIKADGDMMPCRRLPDIIGNVKDGELADIIDASPVMKALREAPIPAECTGCAHAEKCRGGSKCVSRAKTGNSFAKDPDCWIKGGGKK